MSAIGSLRHRVRIEAPLRANDDGGGAAVTWVPIADLWAAIIAVSGRERTVAQKRASEATHRIVIRRRADVDATMRVVHGQRIYHIEAILDPQRPMGRQTLLVREHQTP